MPFQRKLLLIIFLVLIVVLLWPKGQDDLAPSTQDLHQEVEEEVVMQPTPDTRVEPSEQEAQSLQEEQPLEESDVVEDLADVPLSEDIESSEPNRDGRSSAATSRAGLNAEDRDYLEQRGLDNPQEQIISDLMARNELLPQDSLLGGDMRFVQEETQLLNRRWVLATFTDGQTQGQALYEYEVGPDGNLIWVLLAHDSR